MTLVLNFNQFFLYVDCFLYIMDTKNIEGTTNTPDSSTTHICVNAQIESTTTALVVKNYQSTTIRW